MSDDYDKAWADLKKYKNLGGVPDPGIVAILVKASGRTEMDGDADASGDNLMTQAELYAYVSNQMTRGCLKTGKTQTPVALPEGAGGMTRALPKPGGTATLLRGRVRRAAACTATQQRQRGRATHQ